MRPNPSQIGFNLLAICVLASGAFAQTSSPGPLPASEAFRVAQGWRNTLVWSAGLGVLAYLVAFVAAIRLDQPFGPVLVAVLLVLSLGRALVRG